MPGPCFLQAVLHFWQVRGQVLMLAWEYIYLARHNSQYSHLSRFQPPSPCFTNTSLISPLHPAYSILLLCPTQRLIEVSLQDSRMPDNKGYNTTSTGTNSQVSRGLGAASSYCCVVQVLSCLTQSISHRVIITALGTMGPRQPTQTPTTTPTRKFCHHQHHLHSMHFALSTWHSRCSSLQPLLTHITS
jgi:hypothetical protein